MIHVIHELDVHGRPIDDSVIEATFSVETHGPAAADMANELFAGYQVMGIPVRLMRIATAH